MYFYLYTFTKYNGQNYQNMAENVIQHGPRKAERINTYRKTPKQIVSLSLVIVLSLGIGAGAGYFLYSLFGVSGKENDYSLYCKGYDYLSCSEIEDMNDVNLKTRDVKARAALAINTSYYKLYQSPYTYAYTQQVVNVKAGVNVKQDVEALLYFGPDMYFSQNISNSSMVHTSDRYYDYKDGSIHNYNGQYPKDWESKEDDSKTYDEMIQLRGKLCSPFYKLHTEKDGSNRTFASYDVNEKDYSIQEMGFTGFNFDASTMEEASIQKEGDGYLIQVHMSSENVAGFREMAAQMQMTGSLSALPAFQSADFEYHMSENLELNYVRSISKYIAKTMGVKAQCTGDDYTYYFTSSTPFVDEQGREVKPPKPNEEFGESHSLDETKMATYLRGKCNL